MITPEMLQHIESHSHGALNFIAAICRKMGIGNIINSTLESKTGRPSEISYGTLAEIMITMICADHHPLYLIKQFFSDKDPSGIFQEEISASELTDDRFGKLLDKLHAVGPRALYTNICAHALAKFDIRITNINFDTTSKVMWGEYETEEGKQGVVQIDFGHSKDKRQDKKQLKIGLGTANGVIVDAQVLNGNKDDKTFNLDKLVRRESCLDNCCTKMQPTIPLVVS